MPYRDPGAPRGLVFTTFNGQVRALDLHTGQVRWQRPSSDVTTTPLMRATDDRLFLFSSGVLASLEAESGRVLWSAQVPVDLSVRARRLDVQGTTVLLAFDGALYVYAEEDGCLRWQAPATTATWTSSTIDT